jgi:carbamoylphosphate synthase large subunit
MPERADLQSIPILGSGLIVIGQVAGFRLQRHAGRARPARRGYRVILVNSNPRLITRRT